MRSYRERAHRLSLFRGAAYFFACFVRFVHIQANFLYVGFGQLSKSDTELGLFEGARLGGFRRWVWWPRSRVEGGGAGCGRARSGRPVRGLLD